MAVMGNPMETYRSVLVPLDGSAFAAGALAPAAVLAERLGIPVEAVTVATDETLAEDATGRVLAEGAGVDPQVIVGPDVPAALLRHVWVDGPSLVCMSTHGRGRVVGSVMGSVALDVLRGAETPIVVVGPHARPDAGRPAEAAPLAVPRLVACVDGTAASEGVLPVAAAWATALDMALAIVTVVEPAPARSLPPPVASPRVGSMTAAEARAYVADLAESWGGQAPTVGGEVLLDPLSPAAGLTAHLRSRPAGLLAVSTHARSGLRRLWSGATASAIVHASPVPVLVVPTES